MRPAWASGPEWEGWEEESRVWKTQKAQPLPEVFRSTKFGPKLVIWRNAKQEVFLIVPGRIEYIKADSPEEALEKANAIACEFGGWA